MGQLRQRRVLGESGRANPQARRAHQMDGWGLERHGPDDTLSEAQYQVGG
jgi:hypothetical protein